VQTESILAQIAWGVNLAGISMGEEMLGQRAAGSEKDALSEIYKISSLK
jgi:hypothetical protein